MSPQKLVWDYFIIINYFIIITIINSFQNCLIRPFDDDNSKKLQNAVFKLRIYITLTGIGRIFKTKKLILKIKYNSSILAHRIFK